MPRFVEDRSMELFVPGSLDAMLPHGSVARPIFSALEKLDFSAFEAHYANDAMGRPAIDPRRLAGVWILALMQGITSSVQLAEVCARDIEYRWMLGGAAIQKSTLSDFRKHHTGALAQVSAHLLAALARCGQLPGEHLVLDGTIVRAASSCRANIKRAKLEARLQRLKETIAHQLESDEPGTPAHTALARQTKRLQASLEEMTAQGLTRNTDRITTTEPDASMKPLKQGAFAPAHNVQAVCDAQSGVIVHVDVVAQANDQGLLGPQAAQAVETLKAVETPHGAHAPAVETVTADGAYHDIKQMRALMEQKIQPVIPDGMATRRPTGVADAYLARQFTHDPSTDTLRCPHGHTLTRQGLNTGKTAMRYRGHGAVCNACPAKKDCCPASQSGRSVNRPLYPEVSQAVARITQSPEGKQRMRARSVTGEGAFARMKQHLHWPRCRTWGAAGAKAEALWRQLTHNLLLWIGHWKPLVMPAI